MPRKSTAAITTLKAIDVRQNRLQPRDEMPPALKDLFREIVFSVKAEHFREGDQYLIEQYAQAIILARQAYGELELAGPASSDGRVWTIALEKSHRASVALAARLRLCPQSRLSSRAAGREKPPIRGKPIWQDY
jgi:hypothetical protein